MSLLGILLTFMFGILIMDPSHLASHDQGKLQGDDTKGVPALPAVHASGPAFMIDMVLPGVLGDRDDFGMRYCGYFKGDLAPGVEAWPGSSNLEELNAVLCQYLMVRRFKKDVLQDLPPKIPQQICIPVAAKHSREIKKLWAEMTRIKSDSKLSDGRKKTRRDVQLQRLYCAIGEAKAKGAVEQIEASLADGLEGNEQESKRP
ncbi:TPA: hypothetical protein ACH3X1_010438 [Trebouxia sp. C0004]